MMSGPKFTGRRAIVVGTVAAGATWWLTRVLMGQPPGGRPGPRGESRIVPDDDPPPDEPDRTLHRITMGDMRASVRGHHVLIGGDATVIDRQGLAHVWTVQVRAGDHRGRVVSERHYAEEAAFVPPGEPTRLTFGEVIELPAGTYNVRLQLHAVGPGFPWQDLKPGEDLRSRADAMVEGSKIITVE